MTFSALHKKQNSTTALAFGSNAGGVRAITIPSCFPSHQNLARRFSNRHSVRFQSILTTTAQIANVTSLFHRETTNLVNPAIGVRNFTNGSRKTTQRFSLQKSRSLSYFCH